MSPTTRRVMFWTGLALVLVLGTCLACLGYCRYRAVNRLDVLGIDRRAKPATLPAAGVETSVPEMPESGAEAPPVEYETFEKRGVTDVHRVGSQLLYIAKWPLSALIGVGILLIVRSYSGERQAATVSPPIDPLTD